VHRPGGHSNKFPNLANARRWLQGFQTRKIKIKMNIRSRLLTVSNDIIPRLGLQFQDYSGNRLAVRFAGNYPEINENLIRIETLIPRIEINGQEFHIWSEEFQKLAEKNLSRKYFVSLGLIHQYCFNAFCNYFEILILGISDSSAKIKFDEYLFFLKIQLDHDIDEFVNDYKRYWSEFILRIISGFETNQTSFPSLFQSEQIEGILSNLREVLPLIEH
jgi:hypothetical protein